MEINSIFSLISSVLHAYDTAPGLTARTQYFLFIALVARWQYLMWGRLYV